MKKIFKKIWAYLKPFFNLKFLLCFGIAWIITNGWAYIMLGLGIAFKINWAISVSSVYIAFLYLPFTVEKLITIPIALWFHHIFFKKDEKTKKQLLDLKKEAKEDWHSVKMWFKSIYLYRKWKRERL